MLKLDKLTWVFHDKITRSVNKLRVSSEHSIPAFNK